MYLDEDKGTNKVCVILSVDQQHRFLKIQKAKRHLRKYVANPIVLFWFVFVFVFVLG